MREIKFRAWCDSQGYLDKNDLVISLTGEVYRLEVDGESSKLGFLEWGAVLEQFTGLKDKNGVEIYEGDIVYISGLGNCVVDFYIGRFIFEGEKDAGDYIDFCEDIERVIGNIHENPELLEYAK